MNFEVKKPEEEKIDSRWIMNFLQRLESVGLPLHSMILMRHGNIVAETYYAPYTAGTLHRMFSINKSLVSLAIGLLEEEGMLRLDDHIIDYFPEKLPKEGPHPYLAAMTIRHMLMMATCHNTTTYKKIPKDDLDWVGSFFTVKPTHLPGTCFSYDTSASHVLCALVEKLTKTELISYLRTKFLDEIGFSRDAYIIKAPMGESMAGSGLVCTPRDILKIMYLISQNGRYKGKQLLPEHYLEEAVKKQINTCANGKTYDEKQGYGYQIWRTSHDSYALYGMAGQLAVYSPKKDLLLITTADTMAIQGGVQQIYDAYWQEIYDKTDLMAADTSTTAYSKFMRTRSLKYITGNITSPLVYQINGIPFDFDSNPQGLKNVCLEFADYNGVMTYENDSAIHALNFGIMCSEITRFPVYNFKSAVSGAWVDDSNFLIHAQIIDEAVGNLFILLTFEGRNLTVMMKKYEETLFNEFEGFVSGHMR